MVPEGLAPGLALAAPLPLLLAGLLPITWTRTSAVRMARLYGLAAWLAFAIALLTAAAQISEGNSTLILSRFALPGNLGAFSLGAYVNRVTIIMLLLVSFVGAVVTRYSHRYLDGDANQARFHKWLALTLAAILTLIASGNLLMLALAWIATSLCLHQLLMFYRERPAAALAAHKKFVASRISDLCLLGAIFLIGSTLHTLEFQQIVDRLAGAQGPASGPLNVAALLIVVSAALKSAQFPFHGWLIQVMEAPTPVSALLHAGIVNAGAFLVIRMSPVMSHSPYALELLTITGLVTLALASLVMLTQTSIKVSLAWSTTAQMGFMLLECGLGLYSLAMLHLVAHSLYKAHAFLSSGSGVDAFRAPRVARKPGGVRPGLLIATLTAGALTTGCAGAAFGLTANDPPAVLMAGAIVAVAAGQLLLQAASTSYGSGFLVRGLALCAVVPGVYFALHALFEAAVQGSVVPVQATAGPLQTALALVIVGVFIALLLLQHVLQHAPAALGDRVYMHLYNGLYIDVFITRLLQRIWPSPTPVPDRAPAPFAVVRSQGA